MIRLPVSVLSVVVLVSSALACVSGAKVYGW
jgi:hypothetical protein